MYYILYISAAANWMDQEELEQILAVSRKNNALNHVTGVLLYDNHNFIQLLEGEHGFVIKTFDRIGADSRHLDVTVIASGNLKVRCFPKWEMDFRTLRPENKASLEKFIDEAKNSFVKNDCELPIRLLLSFVRKIKK